MMFIFGIAYYLAACY